VTQEIYAGRVVTLRMKQVQRPDGRVLMREIVEHRPGAAVVAVDAEGRVLLVRQARPAVGVDVLELPAGIVEPDETPAECALRELAEETGFTAGQIEPLVQVYSSPGFCTEVLHIFSATGLVAVQVAQDEEEEIEVVRLPLAEAIEQVLADGIGDAKTVAGLLAYRYRH
jgi:ADP-ribose pyrophosphatase